MKKIIAVLLMLSTTTVFATDGDPYRTVRLAQSVNVDGTTSSEDSSGSKKCGSIEDCLSAPVCGTNVTCCEVILGGLVVIAGAIGIGLAASDRDPTRGDGHLTHSNQRTQ